MSNTSADGEQRIFLRKASGLIRLASPLDTFIFNIGLVSVGLGIGIMMYYGPAFYPGGDLVDACIIAGVMMSLVAFGMICWSVTLPRSGGIYVFASRGLPPWLAFTLSLVEVTAWLFYCAIAAYWIVLLGISPTLAMIGYVTGWAWAQGAAELIVEPWPMFVIGSGILILSGLIIGSGMKRFLFSQKIVFVLSLLGSLLLIIVLLEGSRDEFVARFNLLMSPIIGVDDPYNAIIASAKARGWTTEGVGWGTTLKVSSWAFGPLLGAAFSISIAGEIKSVEKSQTYGMLGAIVATVAIWLVTISLADNVFGYEFLGAAVFNSPLWGGTGYTTPTDASITLMAGILTNSWLITLLASMGLILWIWMWIPGMHTFGVRAMVAWAFDRIAPDALGTISPTRHTPTVAIAISVIVTIIFMALFAFTSYFATIAILFEAALLAWSVVLLAGAFFPYTRPHIYEKSPIARKKLFGLPRMTVGCALGFLGSQFYFWMLFFDEFAAGHKPDNLAIVFGVFIIGIAFFFAMKVYRATQGVDVNMAFKEIPIE